jgi:hypothetical protein
VTPAVGRPRAGYPGRGGGPWLRMIFPAGLVTRAGVPTRYVPGPGLIHGFASFLGVVDAADATVATVLDHLSQLPYGGRPGR